MSGKTDIREMQPNKYVDSASPALLRCCVSGRHLSEIRLNHCHSGEGIDFVTMTMTDAIISPMSSVLNGTAIGDVLPRESVDIVFSKVAFSYGLEKPDGQADEAVTSKWDIKANKEA